ncbi:MAG: extracellular solute-binding protein [Chloroflexi bacterium]|nr:extracellular solute-binding protein [Chloroflexota bacterium]
MISRRSLLVGSTGLLALSVACRPGALNPFAGAVATRDIPTYRGSDRQQVLEQGARQEGKLVCYTTLTDAIVAAITNGFRKAYPYVEVEVFRSSTPELQTKITLEAQAHQPSFDVVESNLPLAQALGELGLIAPFFTPEAEHYSTELRKSVGEALNLWISDREVYLGFGYNTRELRPEDVPRTYGDLLSPALKGRMHLAGNDTGIRWLGNVLRHQGEGFVRSLSAQDLVVQVLSAQALADQVASGEAPASPTIFRNHAVVASRKGAPVGWVPLEPVYVNRGFVAVASASPHPHAATLFVDFLLGTPGQQLLTNLDYGSLASRPSFATWDPESLGTAAEYAQAYARWEQAMKSQFIRK